MKGHSTDPRTVRPSAIAGTWYPESPSELASTIDGFLARAERVLTQDELVGLISPHAGYPYSGQTAAYAYRQLEGLKFDIVVVLGPSHYEDYGPFSVTAKKYYATTLGEIELALDFIDGLAKRVPLARVERDREHSIEIQLPFLQRTLGRFRLVPILLSLPFYILGAEALAPTEQFAAALAEHARGQSVLIVASSDLSHLPDYDAVKRFDARLAELIESFDLAELVPYLWQSRQCRACGDAPIVALLSAAKELGADRARVFYRTNSGDVTGIHERGQYTVGYLAAGVYRAKRMKDEG
jgi:hypothetical protein